MAVVGQWHFCAEDGARERTGAWRDLVLEGFASLTAEGLTLGPGSWARARCTRGRQLRDRTFVAWVKLKLTDRPRPGGSPLTLLETDGESEGPVLGHRADWTWDTITAPHGTVGTPGPACVEPQREGWHQVVQVAMRVDVRGRQGCVVGLLRAGQLVSETVLPRASRRRLRTSTVLFGPKGLTAGVPDGYLAATLVAAEIHDEALSEAQLAALPPPPRRADVVPAPTYALIMGISDYSRLDASTGAALGTSDLRGATNDVRSYAMLARTMGVPAENIRVLSAPGLTPNDFGTVVRGRDALVDMNMARADLRYATAAEIRAGIDWLGERLRADGGAQGLVFFSGHTIVTTAGHLAFAAMDTVRTSSGSPHHAAAFGHALDDDWAWMRYFRLVGVTRRLAGLLQTDDPVAIVDVFHRCFDGGACTLESITQALGAAGVDFTEERARAGMRSLVHLTGNDRIGDVFAETRAIGLDVRRAHAVLRDDPFAADDQLDGLVSYLHVLTGGLMPLAEDRAVTFVLETCLSPAPGREIRSHYHRNGIPTAHGNAAVLASCALGENAYTGVFDNRWNGAFTWALTSQLSQRAVHRSSQGRCFGLSYEALRQNINRQLQLVGFDDQTCSMACQTWVRGWPVFGQDGWDDPGQVLETIAPIKLREEIDPGTTGTIFGIRLFGDNAVSGYLVVIGSASVSTNLGGTAYTWQANREYWVGGVPAVSFDLIRPPSTPSGMSPGLKKWIEANVAQPPGTDSVTFEGLSFDNTAGGSSSMFGAHFKVRRIVAVPGAAPLLLARVKRPNDTTLQWYRVANLTGANKLAFAGQATQVTLNANTRVEWSWETATPMQPISWKSSRLVDSAL